MAKFSWDKKFDLLKQYLNENDFRYPKGYEYYNGFNIGSWVMRLRIIRNNGIVQDDGSILYNGSILRKDQINKLESINFIWKSNNDPWEDRFNLLKEYLKEHNNEYPKIYENYKGFDIGGWIERQRVIINNGKLRDDESLEYNGGILTQERIKKLDSINFKRKIDIYEQTWNKNFNILVKYLNESNGQLPKKTFKYGNIDLYSWVSFQKLVFNRGEMLENGDIKYDSRVLTPKNIEKLNSINFKWIANKNRYCSKTIETKEELEKKKRYLVVLLNKMLDNNQEDIINNDTQKINNEFMKLLYED